MGYIERRSKRILPKDSVTVALVDKDYPVAYGVVKDISESGACIITDSPLDKDRDVTLKMSFYRSEMLAAGGRVVWAGSAETSGSFKGTRHGVEFTALSTAERKHLQKILDSETFGLSAD
jgi:hypothetical protein